MKHLSKFSVFDRQYFVSNSGEIFNSKGIKISRFLDKDGYFYVLFRKKNGERRIRKKIFVHRIVAQSFIPNPNHFPEVNHIDGNKQNNSISNLEWVSSSQNQIHSRYILNNHTGFMDVPVKCVETGKQYRSISDAQRDTGVWTSHISECVTGKRKSAGKLHWVTAEGTL